MTEKNIAASGPSPVDSAYSLVLAEARAMSDSGFRLVGGVAVAFIACAIMKADRKSLKADLEQDVGEFLKKTHANDCVNAGLRLALRIMKEKQIFATIASAATQADAADLVAAEARTIAADWAIQTGGTDSLRSLFDALHPNVKARAKKSAIDRAIAAIAKAGEDDDFDRAALARLESAISDLRARFAAAAAADQVADLGEPMELAEAV